MQVSSRLPHALAGLALVAVVGLSAAGCGGDEVAAGPADGAAGTSDTASTAEPSALTDTECEALLPAEVATGLGWSDAGAVTNRATSCQVQLEQGSIEVGRVLGGFEDPQGAYDDACADLETEGLDPADPTGGISGDFEVCATSEWQGTGLARAVVLSPDDVVSEIQLAANTEIDSAAVRTAMSQLAATAASQMPAPR